MELKREGSVLTVFGNIKSIEDFERIRYEVENILKNTKSIIVNIPESISLPSSVIGYLVKLTENGVKVNVRVNGDLYELLDELNLIKRLNVKKI